MAETRQPIDGDGALSDHGGSLRQVTLNTSVVCNFRCTYCAVGTSDTLAEGGRRDRQQDISDVLARLDALFARGYRVVVFSGGEPTVERALPEWLSHARDLGFIQRTMNTNAARLGDRPALAARLVDAGLTHVNVSFHTCRASVFDAISATPGAFERTLRGLDALLAQEPRLKVHCTLLLMKQTADHAGETVRFLAERGVRLITVELVRTKGAADRHFEEVRCEVGAVTHALAEARRAAEAHGVTLNAVDIPSCLLDADDPDSRYDLESYLIRRRKADHWVVNKAGAWPLNRLTHVRGPACAECAFSAWCNGFERALVELGPGDEASRLYGGGPLPPPVRAEALLARSADALATTTLGDHGPAVRYAERALSLLAPPTTETLGGWLRLYAAYGDALLSTTRGDARATMALLGLFPAPRRAGDSDRARGDSLRLLARREQVLERRLSELRAALAQLPSPRPPPCCAEVDQSAAGERLFWLSATLRGGRLGTLNTSLMPELVPFVTCRPSCEAARTAVEARLAALPSALRGLVATLSSLAVLSVGPWVRVVMRGHGTPEALDAAPGAVVWTDPSLPHAARGRLRAAFADRLFALLDRGGRVSVSAQRLIVDGGTAIQRAEFTKTLAWVPALSVTTTPDGER